LTYTFATAVSFIAALVTWGAYVALLAWFRGNPDFAPELLEREGMFAAMGYIGAFTVFAMTLTRMVMLVKQRREQQK
jgi:hypothetical protein